MKKSLTSLYHTYIWSADRLSFAVRNDSCRRKHALNRNRWWWCRRNMDYHNNCTASCFQFNSCTRKQEYTHAMPALQKAAINWLFHMSAAAPSVADPSLLLVLQSGIHCLTVCAIQLLDQSSFDGLWKPTCLPVVIVSLTVRYRCFTYLRYTNVHLLTYLIT